LYSNIKTFVDSKKAKFIKCDIRNFKKIMDLPKVDAVIHLAAIASVVESINNPIFVNDVNVNGTLNILEFCRKKKIKKLVFTSSAAIYGDYEKTITEITPAIPTTVYGATKLTGEQYCKIYSNLFDINITVK
ncbi:MAG: epimerase, partial [Nitrosarchaeum sp.]|nr:epimerase [Nitrosarchaeum sp.]